ncbi:MAG: MATE family efflux transporter [Clostridia bacterium]
MKKSILIGSRQFYKHIFALATPIVIQGGVTNLVSLLDNVMVGQLGTEQMSGIAIANQLLFVYNVGMIGALAGIGIFTAQFFGIQDEDGLCHTLRSKRIVAGAFTALALGIFLLFGRELINSYIHYADNPGSAELARESAWSYMHIMLIGLLPYAVGQVYGTTLRETGRTLPAMVGSVVAVLLNLVLNYLLIFGKCGFPFLGVRGAAIATVISRFAEMLIVVIWAYSCDKRLIRRSWQRLRMPQGLLRSMTASTAPLLINETVYAVSNAAIIRCLSMRGLDAIAASNITTNVIQLFNVILYALGASLGIVVGSLLGASKFDEARETNTRMIALAVAGCTVFALILLPVSIWFPKLFNTTKAVQQMSGEMIRVIALLLPIRGFTHLAYYTLRSGGRTMLTLMFDGGYVTLICLPVTYLLATYTDLSAVALFAVSLAAELSKSILAAIWIKKGTWMRNIVS